MSFAHLGRERRVEGEEGATPFDGGAALASFLKAALSTCFFVWTAVGWGGQFLRDRYQTEFLLSAGCEEEGDALLACIEDFRVRSGRYPATFLEAGCTPLWNRFGGWNYESRAEGNGFALRVGDYSKDGFVLSRDEDDGAWYWDG
jgi:hypothetical protein